jgi:replicative DNA helicase
MGIMQVIENERSLIGGILLNPDKLTDVFDIISIRDFVSENAAISYGAMLSLWKDGKPIAIDTVAHKVGIKKIEWLGNCADVGSVTSLKFNAGIIANEARKRRLSLKLSEIIKQTQFTQSEDMLADILEAYNSEIVENIKDPNASAVVSRFKKSMVKNKERGFIGIQTGLNFFISKNIEYIPGHLWMVGGYTSTGKTAFMVELLSRMFAIGDPRVEIISTEMTDEQLMARLAANKTGFGANAIWSGNLVGKHNDITDDALNFFSGKEYRLHDNIKTIDKVQNVVRKRYLQGGVDIVFIDFIQNLRKPGSGNSYEEKSHIAIDLQNLAKDCKCTIVCLSQITASVHKGNAGIVEYKGAGELAEACDLGLWLQREKEDKRKLLLEIRKNRHGMLGRQVLMYDEYYTSISEHDDTENQ